MLICSLPLFNYISAAIIFIRNHQSSHGREYECYDLLRCVCKVLEEGAGMFLPNLGKYLPHSTASHSMKPNHDKLNGLVWIHLFI
jgi:hypothetical protein